MLDECVAQDFADEGEFREGRDQERAFRQFAIRGGTTQIQTASTCGLRRQVADISNSMTS
jgi:hypothetical protein